MQTIISDKGLVSKIHKESSLESPGILIAEAEGKIQGQVPGLQVRSPALIRAPGGDSQATSQCVFHIDVPRSQFIKHLNFKNNNKV